MANLRDRLTKLEAELTDRSGRAPGTAEWLEYWIDQAYRRFLLKEPGEPIPIAVCDAIIAHARTAVR
jgi:hypothetical protein